MHYREEKLCSVAAPREWALEQNVQLSSTDVMFWVTFNKLQLTPDQLRSYDGRFFGFDGDQVEVREHVELRTTFSDGTSSRTISIRYLVITCFWVDLP